SQTITINPRPTSTVTLMGTASVCAGDTNTVQAVFTGIGPWNFTWTSNGVTVLSGTTAVQTNTLPVTLLNTNSNLPTTAIFKISSLIDQGATTSCAGNSNDLASAQTITINPSPTATVTLIGPSDVCNGQTNTIQAVLTGIGPWTYRWSSNGVNLSPTTSSSN